VFGEGDLLPGLIVDRYGPVLAVQISTLGMDRMREDIVAALQDAVHPHGIYERSDLPTRLREGLESRTGLLLGEVPDEIEMPLDDLRFLVRPRAGQKTGMYLDHRFNRRAVQPHARGRRVLDVFCNSGSFGLYALKAGAERCTGIEISAECLELARRNAALNDLESRCEWIEGNAFDHLKELDRKQERFGLIVLDPPAFTKSARALDAAVRGYKEINLRAFRLAAPGGVIVTSSCSYHLGPEEFLGVLQDAASDAGREVTLVEMRSQAPDHPVHLFVPETRYLKCAILLARN
jgi:23S rRNA (cytosine1962-C5)-methyltransferase